MTQVDVKLTKVVDELEAIRKPLVRFIKDVKENPSGPVARLEASDIERLEELDEQLGDVAEAATQLRRRALPSLAAIAVGIFAAAAVVGTGAYALRGSSTDASRAGEVDLRTVDFGGVDLSGANLSGVDLAGACLEGATLVASNFEGADLTSADLRGAQASLALGLESTKGLFIVDASTVLPDDFESNSRTRLAKQGEFTSCE